jgi:phosphatidylserine decarboxylase
VITEAPAADMSNIIASLFVLIQKALPKYLLTTTIYRLARIRIVWIKNLLITQFVRFYKVDVEEVLKPVPDGFESFNAFFIRELTNGARPIAGESDVIASPVDGTVSAAGVIDGDAIFQAKGRSYSLSDLLATDTAEAKIYVNGSYATIYLAPYNYHRVHAPLDGELVAARYVPGDLFSVNEATVSRLPGIFVRNERLICHLQTSTGPMVLIFVGAMNVGSITTTWTGEIRPRRTGVVEQIDIRDIDANLRIRKGDGIGWFNMGSTVILLHPPASTNEYRDLTTGQTVRMGEIIGRTASAP